MLGIKCHTSHHGQCFDQLAFFASHQHRQVSEFCHVVVIDAVAPLQLKHGNHVFLDAQVEELLHGANVARVSAVAALLHVLLGLQLGQRGVADHQVAAHAGGELVVRDYVLAVGCDANIALQTVVVVDVDSVGKRLDGVLNANVAATMPHQQRLPCQGRQSHGGGHEKYKNSVHNIKVLITTAKILIFCNTTTHRIIFFGHRAAHSPFSPPFQPNFMHNDMACWHGV